MSAIYADKSQAFAQCYVFCTFSSCCFVFQFLSSDVNRLQYIAIISNGVLKMKDIPFELNTNEKGSI